MNKYTELMQSWNQTTKMIQDLEKEYEGKLHGEAYAKRKRQLFIKLDSLKKQAKEVGTHGLICQITGKRKRPHIKNPKIMIQERFHIYFTDVTPEEAHALIQLHVKNADEYSIKFIKPGTLITTS